MEALLQKGVAVDVAVQGETSAFQILFLKLFSITRFSFDGLAYQNIFEMMAILLKNGANPNQEIRFPARHHRPPHNVYRFKYPILNAAVKILDVELVKILLAHGADPMRKDELNTTALEAAEGRRSLHRSVPFSPMLVNMDIVQLLKKNMSEEAHQEDQRRRRPGLGEENLHELVPTWMLRSEKLREQPSRWLY